MRFKKQQLTQPQVNLVPMMDVLMTVLTFFIIISMTLRGQQLMNINLPQTNTEAATPQDPAEVEWLVVGLNKQNQIQIGNQILSIEQLTQQMQTYLTQNPGGQVLLKADRELRYEDVAQLLDTMRTVGGDRVSLAIEGGS